MSNLGCKYKHFEKYYAIKWQFFVQMELYAKAVPRKMERFPAGMENCFLCNPRRLVTHTLRKRHKPPLGAGGSSSIPAGKLSLVFQQLGIQIPFGNGVKAKVTSGGLKRLLVGNRLLPPINTCYVHSIPAGNLKLFFFCFF